MLQLGSLIFDIDDYPSELPRGGSSLVAVEKFPGGRKSLQDFGAFYDPITLQGTFMYQGAVQKSNAVETMWKAGAPVQLLVSSFPAQWVQITAYKPVYKNDYEIDYHITLEPVDGSDLNSILYGESQTSSSSTSSSSSSSASVTPAASPATTATVTATPKKFYVVRDGDSLWKIAVTEMGSGTLYPKIAQANNISNPSLILPGQKLVIPS